MTNHIYTYLKASCHCGLNQFRVAFRTENLPIPCDLCHCDSCRHSSGQMMAYYIKVAGPPVAMFDNAPADLGDLAEYQTGPHSWRYFCTVCSAHMLWVSRMDPDIHLYYVASGVLERVTGISDVKYHAWVEDTKDGGITIWMPIRQDIELPRYAQDVGTQALPFEWTSIPKYLSDALPVPLERLPFYCHCKSLEFFITRPNEDSAAPYAPYPDLLKPYDVTHLSELRNSNDEKWWLRPVNSFLPTKYLAGHCACTTCRLSSGFPIQSWGFVPLANIIDKDGQSFKLEGEGRPKGLKQYISSPGKYREFCSKCGATAFWWELGRPEVVDVSIGLVDENNGGARAEGWFDWHKNRVSFAEMALARPTVSSLVDGLKAAGEKEEQSIQASPGDAY
ncbi:Mss4-like protein [Cyathus striatus]|nr:Mss4-like protein [Cyathus striatus]